MRPSGRLGGRKLAELYFTPDINGYWKCKCGKKRKKAATSYENLLSHIRAVHPEHVDLLDDSTTNQVTMDTYFRTEKAKNYFGWFDLVINCMLPFSFVQNQVAHEHVKHGQMSLSTFMRYLPILTRHVEEKIRNKLPEKFALVFDGWTSGSTHFLAVFASYSNIEPGECSVRLLAFSPFEDESTFNADNHVKFFEYVLQLYERTWDNVVCLIGDNCATNKAIANNVEIPFIGCASHRYNLAVQILLMDEAVVLEKVHTLMSKLKTLTLGAKLFKLTNLKSKTRNATRWSSTYEMLRRYQRIRDCLQKLDSLDVDRLCLTSADNRRVDSLMCQLDDLESVTKALQDDSTTMSDVRGLFDAVIDRYPETACKLTSSASIVHNPIFENAVVKVQLENCNALSREERLAMKSFELDTHREVDAYDDRLSFAQSALKRQRRSSSSHSVQYMNLKFLLPTSNVCERLFSRSGHLFNERRRSLNPANLESQLFLRLNNDLWNAADFDKLTLNEQT
eukprot:IDg1888t1